MTAPPTLEALTERVTAVQTDLAEIKDMLKQSVQDGAADRQQLNQRLAALDVRQARTEEQVRIGKWVLGTIGGAAISGLVLAVLQVIQAAN